MGLLRDMENERLRLAQIELEMRDRGTWGDYDSLALMEEEYPKGAWLSDAVLSKTITRFRTGLPTDTPEFINNRRYFQMAIRELHRRGYARCPRSDGSFDIVKGKASGAESLLDSVEPHSDAETLRQRQIAIGPATGAPITIAIFLLGILVLAIAYYFGSQH
ncbi:MAG TPA: hypothetical protein VKT83_03705 [bacterium]|nr:hypothetical protein [bacterium]